MHPESHLRYHHERHTDLLRQARHAELAATLAASRRKDRETFLARLWWRRYAGQPRPSHA
jgi:hypothetical protein